MIQLSFSTRCPNSSFWYLHLQLQLLKQASSMFLEWMSTLCVFKEKIKKHAIRTVQFDPWAHSLSSLVIFFDSEGIPLYINTNGVLAYEGGLTEWSASSNSQPRPLRYPHHQIRECRGEHRWLLQQEPGAHGNHRQ